MNQLHFDMKEQKIKFDRKLGHQIYKTSGGVRVPGASTISKVALAYRSQGQLMSWANKQGLAGIDIAQDRAACDIGTLAHFLTDCYIRKIEADLTNWSTEEINTAQNAVIKFATWWDENKLTSLFNEKQIVSDKYCFGGTLDNVVKFPDGQIWLIDKKTSKAIYTDHFVQLAGYRLLLEEKENIIVDQVAVVRIGKEENMSDFEVKSEKDTSLYLKIFLLGLDLYNITKKL